MRTNFYTHFVMGLAGAVLLVAGYVHAAPSATHAVFVAQVEKRLMDEFQGNSIKQVPFGAEHLTKIIRDRIDAELLNDNPNIDATDLQFTQPDQKHAVAVMTLTYPTHVIASQQSGLLLTRSHLRNTKVLTPFNHGVVDETLVILFTESSQYSRFLNTLIESLNTKP